MHKTFKYFSFALTVAILIGALKIFNWIPTTIQRDEMRRYRNIEEVKVRLNIKDIYIPAYFPEQFSWPPSEISAQRKPFTAIIMQFKYKGRGDVALIVSQADGKANFIPRHNIKPVEIKERAWYSIKGRAGELVVAVCKDDEPCSQISWDEGEYRINVIAKYPPLEVIKIAESMLH